ncbi:disulfide bond formation protein DsbB [Salirhabdus euzebyi]|uniref:Probable disulfide formation protein n=1 Tax=Salirhabdus euzebyi TaxID=394506 RepID=A0A841Q8U4_9BACI|nr:disulfide oxidoreductase [Salirhabdus euzebyi]MBB6454687.1 disulfide bond formation protein DsbB [Salirhabdus euzebyi]
MKLSKATENILFAMWVFAFVATLGSLFYSEVMQFVPCKLCWIQRILMYPLVIIFGVAYVKKDVNIALPGFILSLIGAPLSFYHYSLQKFIGVSSDGLCGQVPCTIQYINYFGFITIPFLAFVAFTSIMVMYIVILRKQKKELS